MLKKIVLYFLVPVGIILCFYIAYLQLFRPIIFARTISKFDIPINTSVVAFKEQWSGLNGNGYALSKLEVDDEQLENIVKQCHAGNYHILPIEQSQLNYNDENIGMLISDKDVGFYKSIFLKDEFSIIIVNTRKGTITTYTSIF